jgi:hypothetical protein
MAKYWPESWCGLRDAQVYEDVSVFHMSAGIPTEKSIQIVNCIPCLLRLSALGALAADKLIDKRTLPKGTVTDV